MEVVKRSFEGHVAGGHRRRIDLTYLAVHVLDDIDSTKASAGHRDIVTHSPINFAIGIDPLVQFRFRDVKSASPAATACILAGDLIHMMDEQRVLTLADMSPVLELTPAVGTLTLGVVRDKDNVVVALDVPSG